jgi:hypothetical protein
MLPIFSQIWCFISSAFCLEFQFKSEMVSLIWDVNQRKDLLTTSQPAIANASSFALTKAKSQGL